MIFSSGPMWPIASRRGLSRCLCVSAAALVLSGCGHGVLNPQGPIGSAQKMILIDSLAIMLAIIVPTIVLVAVFAWWYRATNTRATHLPDWAYSGRIELVVWAVPLLTITLLGGVTWIGSHELDPAKPIASKEKALEVQVVSLDWKWLFIYPEQKVASLNKLVVPAGRPLHLTLTSGSVMNAFFVPQWGSMIYTMNGMADNLYLQADTIGTYHGLSSHYSGDGFSDMHFEAQAVSADDFGTWATASAKSAESLDDPLYREISRQSVAVTPVTYRLGDPNLFQNIVAQTLPPGPGPEPVAGQPDPSVSPRTGG